MFNVLISLQEIESRSKLANLLEIEIFGLTLAILLVAILAGIFIKQAKDIPQQFSGAGGGLNGMKKIIDEILIMFGSCAVALYIFDGNVKQVAAIIEYVFMVCLGILIGSLPYILDLIIQISKN